MFLTTFGPLEKALAATFGVPESMRTTAFRGWITNLQKLGVLGKKARVGRGAPLVYGPDEWHPLFFALELSEFGFPPAVTVEIIEAYWELRIKAIFKRAEVQFDKPDKPDVVVILGGIRLRSGPWSSHKGALASVPNLRGITISELATHASEWMRGDVPGDLPQRLIAFNLSERLRRFHQVFGKLYLQHAVAERRTNRPTKGKARRKE